MKNFPVIAFVLLCASIGFSQQPKPTPTPNDDDVVKITTNLIQMDVSVTDSKGNPLSDLKPEEVEIYENGKKQEITNFSFISNLLPATSRSVPGEKKRDPGLPPLELNRENVKRTIALVVDDLSLSHSNTFFTKEALRKFVNQQMEDGDMVAIVRTSGGIGALQQFTNDKRRLLAAIDKLQYNMIVSSRNSAFNPIASTLEEEANNRGSRAAGITGETRSDREFQEETNEFRESIFAAGTLGAVNYVIRGMKDLPGRKSIMLLSAGFKLLTRRANGTGEPARILNSLQRLVDLANRASVVIYTIDVRGVTFDGITAADDTSGLSPEQLESRLDERKIEALDTRDGLRFLARETGGLAYFLNFIERGIRKALDDQSYYLIAYEPDPETFDPKKNRFNKIQVKVKRAGVKVRYRSGFFGFSEEQVANPKISPNQALYDALTSPFAVNDISLRLNALFVADKKRTEYLRAFLHIGAKDLTFVQQPDGNYNASIDLIASSFGENGALRDGMRSTYTLKFTEDAYKKLLRHGVVYDFAFKLKKPGAYQVRVAIRDNATNRVGSANQFVDVPNIKKKRLALSGLLLENIGYADWQKFDTLSPVEAIKLVDPLTDTAERRFQPGSVLTYSADVFNPKSDAGGKLNLTSQVKLYSDQDLVFEGKPFTKEYTTDEAERGIVARGSVRLATGFRPGSYTLQFIVTDNNADNKRKVANQFVSFEIIN